MKPAFLILCTGNSARSILAEGIFRHFGGDRLEVYSAGSKPTGKVNPRALALLKEKGISAEGFRSKSWDEFTGANAPKFTAVITVCDAAAKEACPVFYGAFVKAHWGVPDPASATGDEKKIRQAFSDAYDTLHARCLALLGMPFEILPPDALRAALAHIGETVK